MRDLDDALAYGFRVLLNDALLNDGPPRPKPITEDRDGQWRTTHTGPTYGNYRVFDGWWKPGPDPLE